MAGTFFFRYTNRLFGFSSRGSSEPGGIWRCRPITLANSQARVRVNVGSAVTATAGSVVASSTPLRSGSSPRAGSSGSLRTSASAETAAYAEDSKPCSCTSRPAHSDNAIAMTTSTTCSRRAVWASGMRTGRRRRFRGACWVRFRAGRFTFAPGRSTRVDPAVARLPADGRLRCSRVVRVFMSLVIAALGVARRWAACWAACARCSAARRAAASWRPRSRAAFSTAAAWRLAAEAFRAAATSAGVLTTSDGTSRPVTRVGLPRTLPDGTTRNAGRELGRMPSVRCAATEFLGRGPLADRALEFGLAVDQLIRRTGQGPALERLVLQRGVEHQQARHPHPEHGDQHCDERDPGHPGRRARHHLQAGLLA